MNTTTNLSVIEIIIQLILAVVLYRILAGKFGHKTETESDHKQSSIFKPVITVLLLLFGVFLYHAGKYMILDNGYSHYQHHPEAHLPLDWVNHVATGNAIPVIPVIFVIAGAFALICIIAGVYTLIRNSNKNNPNKIHVFKPMLITGLAFLFGIILFRAGTHVVIEINSDKVFAGFNTHAGIPLDQHVVLEHDYPHYQHHSNAAHPPFDVATYSVKHNHGISGPPLTVKSDFFIWAIVLPLFCLFMYCFFHFKWYKKPFLTTFIFLISLSAFSMLFAVVSHSTVRHSQPATVAVVQEILSSDVAPTPQQIQLNAEENTKKKNESIEEKVDEFVESVEKKADNFAEAVEKNVEKIEKQVEAKIAEIEKKTEEIVKKADTVKAKAKAIKKKAEAKAKAKAQSNKSSNPNEQVVKSEQINLLVKTESDTENLPEWTKFKDSVTQNGKTFFVRSEQFATKEEALKDAINIAQKALIDKAESGQARFHTGYGTSVVNAPVVLSLKKMHTEVIPRKTGNHEFKVYRVYIQAGLDQQAIERHVKAIQQAKVNFRVMILFEIVAAIFLLLIMGMMISNGKLKNSRKVQT
jgi:hypothetical protein